MKKIIKDFDYFEAIDSTVRKAMKQFETQMLPVAEKALKDLGIKLGNYPIEGYYPETKELTQYFLNIKTLQDQQNYTEKVTDAVRELHDIYTHQVFGLKQGRKNAINNTDVHFPDLSPVIISPVVDPVTVASDKTKPEWSIDGIMEAVDEKQLGTGLVGFAYLVDEKLKGNKNYNPVATCMGCETTVLSRMVIEVTCVREKPTIDWRVSKEIEEAGKAVLEAYKDMIGQHTRGIVVEEVNPDTISAILKKKPVSFRCVRLNVDHQRQDGHYHWAIDSNKKNKKYNGLVVKEFWRDKIVTTADYQKSKGLTPSF